MTEVAESANNISKFEKALKPFMNEGEVWITNAFDENSEEWRHRVHTKEDKSGQQLAAELMSYGKAGKWKSIRVIDKAFDIDGNPLNNMVALVGTPK